MLFSAMQQQKKVFLKIYQDVDLHDLSPKEMSSEENFNIYDITQWKVTSAQAKTEGDLMKKQESLLQKIKNGTQKDFGVVVSSPQNAEVAALYAHFLYIPGEVCRQSDVLEACAQTKLPLLIEKGKFLAPNDIKRILQKIKDASVALVECGTAFGYSDAILDIRSLVMLKETGHLFGINLSALVGGLGEVSYSHAPQWLKEGQNNCAFTRAFIMAGNTFGASFYVTR